MFNKTTLAIFLQDYGGVLALLGATVATLGSLYYSEVAGFVPCTLCWYQRILMYPLVVVTLVGIIKQDEYLPVYVLPFSLLGIGVSSYHFLIQNGIFSHPATCTVGVPCSLRYVNYFGFITIPLLALTAFVLITAVMIATRWAFAYEFWEEISDAEQITTAGAAPSDPPKLKWWLLLTAIVLVGILLALAIFSRDNAPENSQLLSNPTEPVSGEALFAELVIGDAPGCILCHSLEPDTVLVGPSVAVMANLAGERIPGKTAADYLRESIIDPDAYIVEGFTAGVMYENYGEALTEEQLEELVTFLLTSR